MPRHETITIKRYRGKDITPHIGEIARFRIEGFRAFPYLYEGSMTYEEKYLSCYGEEEHALLVCAYSDEKLCAVATSLPLACESEIVGEAPELFRASGFNPKDFYYFAEIIVSPAMRGHGIAKDIYQVRQEHARELGLTGLCLAVVQRPTNDPLKPKDYISPERIWIREGFEKTSMTFHYEWPTIQPDGTVRSQKNEMRFWIKSTKNGMSIQNES